ncbi:MAG TPA: FliH/SctL family protein [Lacisediminihabitans sp.]|uniref:FliH/SctL family protein n=1 Tax=Lacisediminihabitans sp. TaxID=2787631 RepID=UPI002ED88D3B
MSVEATFSEMHFPMLHSTHDAAREAEARASGHAAGYAAGLRRAETELTERAARLEADYQEASGRALARLDRAVEVLAASARAVAASVVPVIAQAQDVLADSALELAEAIVGVELSDAPRSAAAAVRRALGTVDPALVQTVRLNPDDLETLDAAWVAAAGVVFTGDPELARGDAISELEVGYLDARVSSALARARAAIGGEAS